MPSSLLRRNALPLTLAALSAAALLVGGHLATASSDRPLKSIVSDLPTLPAGADIVFVAAGDNRPTGSGAPMPRVVRTIFEEIGLIRPDFVLWSGDTVYGYCDTPAELGQEHDAFLGLAQLGKAPLFNTTGNHEIHNEQYCVEPPADQLCGGRCATDQYVKRYGNTYGSFDAAGAHFIAISTDVLGEEDDIKGAQLAWLKSDLEANKNARAIFLYSHTEFYSSPKIDTEAGNSHPPIASRDALHALFKQYPVKAVFSGHEHLYSHENHDGIDYFILGGAGAPLYASPEDGGFSQYLVVRLHGSAVSYDVIEPGRLFTEGVAAQPGKLWVVNSNNSDLPLRGIELKVPATLGDCMALAASGSVPRRKNDSPPFDVASCETKGTELAIRLRADPFPKRKSILVTVAKRPQ